MIKRTDPRDTTRGHYAWCGLSSREDEPIAVLKLSPSRSAEIVRWMYATAKAADADVKALVDSESATEFEALVLANQYKEAIHGRVVGLLWAHEDYDLECIAAEFATPEDMGIAVFAELYEHGYSEEEIESLYGSCLELCLHQAQRRPGGEVTRILNFGRPVPGEKITPSLVQA